VAKAKTKDPIITFGAYLKETGVMNDVLEKEINDRVMEQVNEATDYAENAPYAAPEHALKYVYGDK
jgi:2-oxoisovalerate dehydrogenase E1 component alpha subunit